MKSANAILMLFCLALCLEAVRNIRLMADIKQKQKLFLKKITTTPLQNLDSVSHMIKQDKTHSTGKYSILSKFRQMPKHPELLKSHLHEGVTLASHSIEKESGVLTQSLGIGNLHKLGDIFKTKGGLNHRSSKEHLASLKNRKSGLTLQSEGSSDHGIVMMLNNHNKGASVSKAGKKGHKMKKSKKDKSRGLVDEDEADDEPESGDEESGDEEVAYEDLDPNDLDEEEDIGEQLIYHSEYNIEDLEKVVGWAQNVREIVKRDILGSLQNKMMLKRLERSYEVYEEVNHVRKKYHFRSKMLDELMNKFSNVVIYLVRFVEVSEHDETIKDALMEKGIVIDEHNHSLLLALMHHLAERVARLHIEITETFKGYFDELDQIHFNSNLSDYEKVGKFIKIASNISIFENNIVQTLIMEIKDLAMLVENNPRYHHLASAFKREFISLGDREKRARMMGVSRHWFGAGLLGLVMMLLF